MTRSKDIFWGIYAALLPIVNINIFGKFERLINQYMSRTYDSATALYGLAALALLHGIMLAVLSWHYLSKPVETSRLPLVGLCIGLVYCLVVFMYWPLGALEIDLPIFNWIGLYAYGSLKMITIMGFYAVLLVIYLKTRNFIPKKELMNGIETESKH